VTVFLLGLDPLAAAIIGYVGAFYGLFQHWNVRTPRWLGYVIQRPEAHCHHHELNVHLQLRGTCRVGHRLRDVQESRLVRRQGRFADQASFGKMLVGVDVNEGLRCRPTRYQTVAVA